MKTWKTEDLKAGLRLQRKEDKYLLIVSLAAGGWALVDLGRSELIGHPFTSLQSLACYLNLNGFFEPDSPTVKEEHPATLTWDQLTIEQQAKAVEFELNQMVVDLTEGTISLRDPVQQGHVDQAIGEANRMQTPWFAASYVYDRLAADLRPYILGRCRLAVYENPEGPHISQVLVETES